MYLQLSTNVTLDEVGLGTYECRSILPSRDRYIYRNKSRSWRYTAHCSGRGCVNKTVL